MNRDRLKSVVHVLAWILALFLALAYLLQAAYPKLAGDPGTIEQFEAFGYPGWFRIAIGLIEGLGAILLIVPRTSAWGAGILITVMAGAVYSHLSSGLGSPFHASRNMVLLAIVAWARWRLAWRPTRLRPARLRRPVRPDPAGNDAQDT